METAILHILAFAAVVAGALHPPTGRGMVRIGVALYAVGITPGS
jgi:hypothetical protein